MMNRHGLSFLIQHFGKDGIIRMYFRSVRLSILTVIPENVRKLDVGFGFV